jgi:colanic acid/amylovoran biosynthesis glycosyltransferase
MKLRVFHFKLRAVGPFESFIQTQIINSADFVPVFLYLFPCKNARKIDFGIKLGFFGYLFLLFCALWQKKHPLLPQKNEPLHAHFGSNAFLALPLSILTGSRLITSFYGHDYSSFPQKSPLHKILIRLVLRRSHTIIAMTDFMDKKLITLGCPKDKIQIFQPGAITLNYTKPPVTQIKNLLMVAALRPKKNHLLVIKALHLLHEKRPELNLTLVGEGPQENELKKTVQELKLSDRVIFAGLYRKPAELINHYEQADLFLHPSLTAKNGCMEGFPTAIWEALSAGLPVITTRHANIDKIIHDCAIFVDEKDPQALADAIENLIENPQTAAKLQNKARQLCQNLFDRKEQIKKREAIYRNLI